MATPTCCGKVKPENAARKFPNPAPILSNSRVQALLNSPVSIIEIGAGCLRNAIHLQKLGHRVSVLEVGAMTARFPEEYKQFEKKGRTLNEALPQRPRYDIAIATFVIETICDPGTRITLLQSVLRCLKSKGALVLSVRGPRDLLTAFNSGKRCGDGFVTPNLSFSRAYTRAQLQDLLLKAGFKQLDFLHKQNSVAPELLHVIAWKN